jgi:Tfp pilus assembly pilus retraction ATPase PilT
MRVERIQVATSKVIYVCRRFRLAPGTLASLGMPLNVADKLLSPELTEGLVIFLGKAGAGKTTTAFSFLIERLSLFGGVCFTIENPIELQVEGKHGKGRLYQSQVTSDTAIGPAIQDRLRGSPNIFFIGELRDGLAIREAITAATSGHLVVATFHSADLLTGIARLVRLAGDNNASSAVADALRVAIHLSLHNLDPNKQLPELITTPNPKGTGTPARVLSVEPLWMTGQTSDGLKSMLRDGDVHLLKSELERQRRSFLMSKLP